ELSRLPPSLRPPRRISVSVVSPEPTVAEPLVRGIVAATTAICPVVVVAPIGAPMGPAIDTIRCGTVRGQRYTFGRDVKREGSCTQNAAEQCSCADSDRFRHCDLLSKPTK